MGSPKCWNFVVHHRPFSLPSNLSDLLTPSDADKNAIIGMCGIYLPPELGYNFHPDTWGKGIATEAIAGLVKEYWERWPEGHPLLEGYARREPHYLSL